MRISIGLALLSLLLAPGCTKAKGSSPAYAVEISGPAGVKCYAILNGVAGEPVGGNCIPQ